ncbi:hypothetical protein DTW90_34900 [Neorhizobium sp. P12A]|nr:hypothetical protein DTW90_34900 [Neorhizobium sp. P12A]
MIVAAKTHAIEIGARASIVVLGDGGDLVAMVRMDGAWAGAFDRIRPSGAAFEYWIKLFRPCPYSQA